MNKQYHYAIIEDAPDVCEGIKDSMLPYTNWICDAIIYDIDTAKNEIATKQPALLFMDWSIRGGSTFELLDYLLIKCPHYKPYIVYFTAFQNDEPQIPMLIVNKYKPDRYLIKPIWEYFSADLETYLQEAIVKNSTKADFILRTINKEVIYIQLQDVASISMCDSKNRTKIIYLKDGTHYEFKDVKLDEFCNLFTTYNIDHFRANKKENIVCRNYINSYQKPFIHFINPLIPKVEVSAENYKACDDWIRNK
jgi:two-component system, LytTR family, response regulator